MSTQHISDIIQSAAFNQMNNFPYNNTYHTVEVSTCEIGRQVLRVWCNSNIEKSNWIPESIESGEPDWSNSFDAGVATFCFKNDSIASQFKAYAAAEVFTADIQYRKKMQSASPKAAFGFRNTWWL